MSEYTNRERTKTGAGVLFVILGFVLALASLVLYPYSFITGVVGIVLGILAQKNNNRAGLAVIIANIVLMGIGLIYSGAIMAYLRHILGI